MENQILRDIWECNEDLPWMLEAKENDPEIDGKVFLGRVKGPFFFPDAASMNGRYYEAALWEDVMAKQDFKSRLEGRTMWGCIGHEDKPITEKDLEQGKVSHVMTKVWVEPNINGKKIGMGEALIYNTPAGRNLYIYLKGGSKLKSSSRANGKLESRRVGNGVPVVDRKSYIFETFDFVIKAGFPDTDPKLTEVLSEKQHNNMELSEAVFTSLTSGRDKLQGDLSEALRRTSALETTISTKDQEIKSLQERLNKPAELSPTIAKMCEALGFESEKGLFKFFEGLDVKAFKLGLRRDKVV